jgi:hypothetical protein
MSCGKAASEAFLASSKRQGLTASSRTLIPKDLAIDTVRSVEPVSAINR